MPAALARYASGNVTGKLECGDSQRLEVGFAKISTVQIRETRCSRRPRSFLLVSHPEVIARCTAEMSACHSRRWKVLARNRTTRVICPLLPPGDFAKCLPISRTIGRAVGIEIVSLLHKDLHGNDLVPLLQFQLLLNVVTLSILLVPLSLSA